MACDLESQGWRQGCLVRQEDIVALVDGLIGEVPADAELVVISQSCDLARNEYVEPNVEVIVATRIDKVDGNYTFNKNGRTLDFTFVENTETRGSTEDRHLRLQATKKIAIPKKRFDGKAPDLTKALPLETQKVLASWLAGRYSRPALPTDFNNAIEHADKNLKKLRRLAKRLSPHTAGLYADILPNRDLQEGEKYRVNILALVIPSATTKIPEVDRDAKQLKAILESAGMDVNYSVHSEDQISVSTTKRMQRFYLDDISYRENHPLPPVD